MSWTYWSPRRCILETPSVWNGCARHTKGNQELQWFKLRQRWWIPCLCWSFYHWCFPNKHYQELHGWPCRVTGVEKLNSCGCCAWGTIWTMYMWLVEVASRRIVTAFGATSLLRVAEKEAVDAKQVRVWSRCSCPNKWPITKWEHQWDRLWARFPEGKGWLENYRVRWRSVEEHSVCTEPV